MYEQLEIQLIKFLMDHRISISYANVFEEVLLKIAGINKIPKTCHFGKIGNNKMLFEIQEITEEEAIKFLRLFLRHGDTEAFHTYLNESDTYFFTVNTQVVFEKIFPLFQQTIISMTQQSKQALKKYQLQSVKSEEMQVKKLLDSISSLEKDITAEREHLSPSWLDSIKKIYFTGSRNNFVEICLKLKSAILKNFFDENSYQEIIDAYQLFYKHCKYLNSIENAEKVKNLNIRLENYCKKITPATGVKKRYFLPENIAAEIKSQNKIQEIINDENKKNANKKRSFGMIAAHLYKSKKSASQETKSLQEIKIFPVTIQALIASYISDPKRGMCEFGPESKILYPSDMSSEKHQLIETHEVNLFTFFKDKFSSTNENKDKETTLAQQYHQSQGKMKLG